MKATRLGNIIFEYPQEVQIASTVMEDRSKSAAGTDIVYMSRDLTPSIVLASALDDWLNIQNIADVGALSEEIRSTPLTLYYEDGSTDIVLFDHTKPPVFTEILEGSCFYYGTISLARVTN